MRGIATLVLSAMLFFFVSKSYSITSDGEYVLDTQICTTTGVQTVSGDDLSLDDYSVADQHFGKCEFCISQVKYSDQPQTKFPPCSTAQVDTRNYEDPLSGSSRHQISNPPHAPPNHI